MKYPQPHPKFLEEHQRVVSELRDTKALVKELEERAYRAENRADRLLRQLNGGVSDPRETFTHPGNTLIMLGWEFDPNDLDGCNWRNPAFPDEAMCLVDALGVAVQRLLERSSSVSPRTRALLADEDDFDDA